MTIFLLRLCFYPILRNVMPNFVNVDNKKMQKIVYEKWVRAFEIYYLIMDIFVLNQINFWLSECMLTKFRSNIWFQNFELQLRIWVTKRITIYIVQIFQLKYRKEFENLLDIVSNIFLTCLLWDPTLDLGKCILVLSLNK